MDEKKIFVTPEQALSVLPDGDEIHTFRNAAFGLMGCDWDKTSLEDKLRKSDFIEIIGKMAKGMKHGIAAYNKGERQSDVLFIETDMEKLASLEREAV